MTQEEPTMQQQRVSTNIGTIQTVVQVICVAAIIFGITSMMDMIRDVERMVVYIEMSEKTNSEFNNRLLQIEARNKQDAEYNKLFDEMVITQKTLNTKLDKLDDGMKFLMQQIIEKDGVGEKTSE
ncbi:MAG: hypothetical protein HOH07_06665 [Euryarchaeota archaeon]|jgi:hypothetical protein|nr:hypothetical protein [Euryarchaeota archaeon]